MPKLAVQQLDVRGKRVLIRVDFNVPQDDQGRITDDTRIRAALPTINYVLDNGGKAILMSHLGRPKEGPSTEFSLAPCAKRLSELLKKPVVMAPDCVGPEVEKLVAQMKPSEVLLLENLRFYPAEEKPEKDPEFVKKLAKLGDLYVNDAFGTAHRAHSSTALIAEFFPGKAAAGLLMQKEIAFLGEALLKPKRPFYAIIGGAKVSSKLGVIQSLLKSAEALFIGGGMAFTFMKAKGLPIGDSICEDGLLDTAKEILSICQKNDRRLFLPIDFCAADQFRADAHTRIVKADAGIPAGFQGLDIGPETIFEWAQALKDAKTIFWNGPLGVAEFPAFAKGTQAIAQVLAELPAVTIVGGGDSVAALEATGVAGKITHISTGGGASLEYIEHGKLPGIDALSEPP